MHWTDQMEREIRGVLRIYRFTSRQRSGSTGAMATVAKLRATFLPTKRRRTR